MRRIANRLFISMNRSGPDDLGNRHTAEFFGLCDICECGESQIYHENNTGRCEVHGSHCTQFREKNQEPKCDTQSSI
jgi:hypothetical protein